MRVGVSRRRAVQHLWTLLGVASFGACGELESTRVSRDAVALCDSVDTWFAAIQSAREDRLWQELHDRGVPLEDSSVDWWRRAFGDGVILERLSEYAERSEDTTLTHRLRHTRATLLEAGVDFNPQVAAILDTLIRALRGDVTESGVASAFPIRGAMPADKGSWFVRLVRLRNQEANGLGYGSYVEMRNALGGIDRELLTNLYDRLDEGMSKEYDAALDSVRRRSLLSHGAQDLVAFAYGDPFDSNACDGASARRSVAATFHNLGFPLDDLPIFIDSSRGFSDARRGGKSLCFAAHTPEDIRVSLVRPEGSYPLEAIADHFRALGSAVYFTGVTQTAYSERNPIGEFWPMVMGELFAEMVAQPDWLRVWGDSATISFEKENERALRRIIRARFELSLARFEFAAYQDPNRDLNDLFWRLVNETMRLNSPQTPPIWLSYSELYSAPGALTLRPIVACVVAQTYAAAGRDLGSLVNNPLFGKFLSQRYFAPGASRLWSELVFDATGERLNPNYFLERLTLPESPAVASSP